jgi:septum formation protein
MKAKAVLDLNGNRLYLASKSPRRAALFDLMGFDYQVIDSEVDEREESYAYPEVHVLELALKKATQVAEQVETGYVVGADTIVVLHKAIIEKPVSEADAKRMLKGLSGNSHMVYTGFAVIEARSGDAVSAYEKTRVTFRKLDDTEIERYVALEQPMDKAGSYGIQDQSAVFVERIEGCFYNVVGFPVTRFYQTFKEFIANRTPQ